MRLPMPNAKEVADFQLLYSQSFNVTLTKEEALDTATRLVHLFCLLNDEIHFIRKEK